MDKAIEKLITKRTNYTPEEAERLADVCQVLLDGINKTLDENGHLAGGSSAAG